MLAGSATCVCSVMYVCMYVYMYACMYVCIYVWVPERARGKIEVGGSCVKGNEEYNKHHPRYDPGLSLSPPCLAVPICNHDTLDTHFIFPKQPKQLIVVNFKELKE